MTAPGEHPAAAAQSAGAGSRLRAAREAAGWSLDQVAQQLKLAPRQVKALEEEDFAQLPGRTFARGFVRNYARLVNLDAQDLLAQLPDAAQAPSLEAPALQSTGAMIAELPSSEFAKPGLGRWLIPLVLIGCIVAAAAYEWYRGGLPNLSERQRAIGATDRGAPAPAANGTPLPNPLAPATLPAAAADAAANIAAAPRAAAAPIAAPEAEPAPASAASRNPAAGAAADAPLVLQYSGPSWTEIRDRSGQVLISRLVTAGSVEPIIGAAPFDIVLGNAHVVMLTYRGKPVDLSPYIRQNVARLTLR